MNNESQPSAQRDFRVTIGHAAVRVTGQSRADAIRVARRRLCTELPHMWDVIHSAHESRFRVDRLH